MTFQLDTSGSVVTDNGKHTWTETTWSDLSPFCQGYIEALPWEELSKWKFRCATCQVRCITWRDNWKRASGGNVSRLSCGSPNPVPLLGFRHLAPATLSRIIADCERFECDGLWMSSDSKTDVGRAFWFHRQSNGSGCFPPLTVTLGDDGLIYLGEAA